MDIKKINDILEGKAEYQPGDVCQYCSRYMGNDYGFYGGEYCYRCHIKERLINGNSNSYDCLMIVMDNMVARFSLRTVENVVEEMGIERIKKCVRNWEKYQLLK